MNEADFSMSNNKNFWQKKMFWIPMSIIVLGILLFFVPFIINWSFRTPATYDAFLARWGAGDTLAFYGAILATAGTIILGYVAYWQSKLAHKLNERLLQHTETSLATEHAALIIIDDISFEYDSPKNYNPNFLTQHLLSKLNEEVDSYEFPLHTMYPITLKPKIKVLSGFVSSVEVESVNIVLSDKKLEGGRHSLELSLFYKQIETARGFSPVAIRGSDRIEFKITLLSVRKNDYDKIKKLQQNGIYGNVEIDLKVATFSNIVSRHKLRIFLLSPNDRIGELKPAEDHPPLCFVKGKPVLQDEIQFLENLE